MKRKVMVLLIGMVMMFAACKGASEQPPEAETENTESVSEEKEPADDGEAALDEGIYKDASYWAGLEKDDEIPWVCTNERTHKVGIITVDLSTEFYNDLVANETKYFEEAGYTLTAVALGDDAAAASSTIDSWVIQGYDAIIFHGHTGACDDALVDAMNHGVLVVSQSFNSDAYHYYISMDNYDAGYKNGTQAADWAKEHYNGECQYIIVECHTGEGPVARSAGLEDSLKENLPNGECVGIVDVVNADQARNDIETLLIQYPDVKFVTSYYCDYALVALEAAKSQNMAVKDEFAVFGIAMNTQVLEYLQAGDTCYEGEIWLGDQAYMQYLTVTTLLDGGARPHIFDTPAYPVNHENIGTYYQDYYDTIIQI